MPTKVSVFGQESTEQPKELKKIEFVKSIDNDGTIRRAMSCPLNYERVMLVDKTSSNNNERFFDIIIAFCPRNERGFLFLGHWNDGIV